MKYIQLLTVVTLVSLGQTTTLCSDNQVYHSNGKCCQYVRCEPQHLVKVCESNGEADVCVPCPEGTYLDDRTDSNFIFDCLEKNCGEDTVPSDYPATKFDNTACPKRCRCNTAKNYCGTDPCRCQYHLCVHPEEELQENCTCIRKEKRKHSTKLTLSTTFSTNEDGQVSQHPPGSTIHSTSSKIPNIANDTNDDRNDKEKEIITPKWMENHPRSKEPSFQYWISIPVIVILAVVFLASFTYMYVRYSRRRGKESNVTYSYHSVHNHQTVNTYERCNVQIGNKNTLNVCDMGENVGSEPSE
ncbi:uncharacterized protein LOC134262921 [Saccostrea cucullata]|uniref:uncharacterized protein LOC134262921 n=1 Tax=Saccostrea cuccullata TaxID=36930 RepID=UPI002ED2F513